MNEPLLTQIDAGVANAPVVVLFGGNPYRRDEVLRLIQQIGGITAYGTLSEEEGMERLQTLPHVDLVLIGGRYSPVQRQRIRQFITTQLPQTQLTEPGYDYPYANGAIRAAIRAKLNRQ
jgi:hypothetical protein